MRGIKSIIATIGLLVVLGFVLFLINQVSGIYLMVDRLNPVLGIVSLIFMIVVVAILLLWPVVVYVKFPKALIIPTNDEEFAKYQQLLIRRLQSNPLLKEKGIMVRDETHLPEAVNELKRASQSIISTTSNAVFLTTAISQNGKLDALTVLVTQSRMVWKIAHVYNQRPSIRDLAYLYVNVGATSLLAAEIEEVDLTHQIEPVVRSLLKHSAGKSLPVIGPTAHVILDSLIEGSTNALLTLRVGSIATQYCATLKPLNKKEIKREAWKDASVQIKAVIKKSSSKIISEIVGATKKAGVETVRSAWAGVRDKGSQFFGEVSEVGIGALGVKKRRSNRVEDPEEELKTGER